MNIKILKGGLNMLLFPTIILFCCCCCFCCSTIVSIYLNIDKNNDLKDTDKIFSLYKIKSYLEKNYLKICTDFSSQATPVKCTIKNKNYEINKNKNGCLIFQKDMVPDTIKCETSNPTPRNYNFDLTGNRINLDSITSNIYEKKIKKTKWQNEIPFNILFRDKKKNDN